MKKLIDFKGLAEMVQFYADRHCEGNFSMAVRKLIILGISIEVDEQ